MCRAEAGGFMGLNWIFEVGVRGLGLVFPDTEVRVPGLDLGFGCRGTVVGSEVGVYILSVILKG